MAHNIIGDSFDEYVKEQILVRQAALGLGPNDPDIVNFKHNNSAFIRLTSGVNVSSGIVTSLGLTGTGYEGSGLAKKFKLFAARAQSGGKEDFTSGIGYDSVSSYGFMSDPDYGYVPPPGIISAEVKAMNRGSLREATIEIKCHNLQQFQILEILYMRLKYSILLEWGHNMYYSNPTRNKKNSVTEQPQLIQSRFDLSDEMLGGGRSQQNMLNLIANTRANSFGNYDAFFGLVTNFSWTLRPDGGYDITVTARAMGDVIESLKINTAYPMPTAPGAPALSTNGTPNTALQTDAYKTSLNRVLSTIVYKMWPVHYCHGIDEGAGAYTPINNYKLEEFSGLEAAFNRTTLAGTKVKQDQDYLTYKEALDIGFPNLSGGVFGTQHYYMKLGTLLRVIESFLIYYDTNKGNKGDRPPVFKIDYNYNTNYCLTFPRHASLNPKVCLIPVAESASSGPSTGLAQLTTTYTYLTKDNPKTPADVVNYLGQVNARSFGGGGIPGDIEFASTAGNVFYSNEFAWRDDATSPVQGSITNLPPSITIYGDTDYVAVIERVWSDPQVDETNRIYGYNALDFYSAGLRNTATQTITPQFGVKYITNIDVKVAGTDQTLSIPTGGGGSSTFQEKVYKASIVITEYRDLGSNYGGGANVNLGEEVYRKSLSDIPFRAGGFKGRTMHMLVNMEYIASTLSKYVNVENGEIALYDFLDNLMKGIQHALGNVNNFEIVYDEDNNMHRIIDNTTIPGVADTSKGIVEFNTNVLQPPRSSTNNKVGGSFVKSVNFRTKLSNNFATMTTIGAQKNGNAVGANSTMLSKWNNGLTDRIITNRENPNYDSSASLAAVNTTFVKNVIALQDLNSLVNNHTVGEYEVGALEGSVNDLFQAELGQYVNKGKLDGIGFIPFDLELTMLGLSGPRIYETYTIDTTKLPQSYKNKIQFICTGVSHKIADGEWTTTLNSIAGPKQSSVLYDPDPVTVMSKIAPPPTGPTLGGGITTPPAVNTGVYEVYTQGALRRNYYEITLHHSYNATKTHPITLGDGTIVNWNVSYRKSGYLANYSSLPTYSSIVAKNNSNDLVVFDWVLKRGGSSDVIVPAPFDGKVVKGGLKSGGGATAYGGGVDVVVDGGSNSYIQMVSNDNSKTAIFLHMREMYFKAGDTFSKGQGLGIQGTVGSTSTGVHLHIEGMALQDSIDYFNFVASISSAYNGTTVLS
jgi:hypothetical protein